MNFDLLLGITHVLTITHEGGAETVVRFTIFDELGLGENYLKRVSDRDSSFERVVDDGVVPLLDLGNYMGLLYQILRHRVAIVEFPITQVLPRQI